MRLSRRLIIAVILSLIVVVIVTALFVPQETSPGYAAALAFVNGAGKGDDTAATAQLSDELHTYVTANCPDASVSACIDAYTPPEWGNFLNAVFRRAQPDGSSALDVLLIATYEKEAGFSGICIYNRVEQMADASWKVTRWSGWIPCGSGLADLMNVAAPNTAP